MKKYEYILVGGTAIASVYLIHKYISRNNYTVI